MSEELYQKRSLENMTSFGEFSYLNIGNTTFKKLKELNIIKNNIRKDFLLKKPDGLILSGKSSPYEIVAIVENKDPVKFKTKSGKLEAIEQVAGYCFATKTNIGAISDGLNFNWFLINSNEDEFEFTFKHKKEIINCNRIRYSNGNEITCNDLQNNKESQFLVSEIIKSIDITSSILTSGKIIVNPTNLAKSIWQSIWLATGDNPKMCLMTFTEIFMYKYLSDLELIKQNDSGVNISFIDTYNTGKDKCLKFYMQHVRSYIKTIFPPAEDGTSIINGMSLKENKNQDELFFNILESFKKFGSLKGVSIEFKSNLFEEFLKGSNGIKLMAQFFTPRNIVRAMVDMAQVNKLSRNQIICDPACGVGGFILESMIKRNLKSEFSFSDNEFDSESIYLGFDLDEQTIILAKASLTILLSDYIKDYKDDLGKFSKYINKVFKSFHSSIIGSLENTTSEINLILSNPPYVRKGLSLYHDYINNHIDLTNFYDIKISSKEGLFVLNMIKSLVSGGRAFIILPDGFFHTKSDKPLRDYLLNHCFLDGIISLPQRTFYTTAKKTYIICLTKKKNTSEIQNYPVFNYILKDVGETLDAIRMDTNLSDLNTLVKEFRYFYSSPNDYTNEELPQIIIQPIEYYQSNNMWMTEQIISDELKKILKIKNEVLISSTEDVASELIEIQQTISDTINRLNSLDKLSSEIEYCEVPLTAENGFNFISNNIGYKQKEYLSIGVEKEKGFPVYTAARLPVTYFLETHKKLNKASEDNKHVSVATDGDGCAGTNIILHNSPYFLNTSRISIEINNDYILPEYLYFNMKSIKQQFGFGYSIKCSPDNFVKYFKIKAPIDEDGKISVKKQQEIVDIMKQKEEILTNLEDNIEIFNEMKNFNKYLSIDI